MRTTGGAKGWIAGMALAIGVLASGCAAETGSDEATGSTSASTVEALESNESSSLADEAADAVTARSPSILVDDADLRVSLAGGGLLVTHRTNGRAVGSLYFSLQSLSATKGRLRFVKLGDVHGLRALLPKLAAARTKLETSASAEPAGCDDARWAVAKDLGLAAITLAGVAVETYFVVSGAALLAPVGCVLAQWYACGAAVLIWTAAPAALVYLATHNHLLTDWTTMRATCQPQAASSER